MSVRDKTLDAFLASLGAKTPTPGGGAVAGLAAATSAATGLMVISWSAGRKSLAEHAALHEEARRTLEAWQRAALDLADADAEAYLRLNRLAKLDPDDAERQRSYPAAVRAAIDVPARVLGTCVELLELYERLCGRTNRWLDSDLAIAAILAAAGAHSAAWNVRINLPALDDAPEADRIERETTEKLGRTDALRRRVEACCRREETA